MSHRPDPHDAFVQYGRSIAKNAIAELRAVLPPDLVSHIDWKTLRIERGTFVDRALERSHSDLLYAVDIAAKPAFIYVLFEHQSPRDPWLGLRRLRYVLRILEQWRRDHPRAMTLPPVVAVVLHPSNDGWHHPTDLLSLFGDLPQRIPSLRPLLA